MLTRFIKAFGKPMLIPLLAAVTMAYAPCSSADPNTVLRADNGWDVRTAAYLWVVGIDGTQTVKGEEAELEVNFSDILDIMDFAGEAHVAGQSHDLIDQRLAALFRHEELWVTH